MNEIGEILSGVAALLTGIAALITAIRKRPDDEEK